MNLASSGAVPGVVITGIFVWLGVFFWIAPIIIAVARENPNRAQVVVVDLLLGWTGIGWIVALVMALQAKPRTLPYSL